MTFKEYLEDKKIIDYSSIKDLYIPDIMLTDLYGIESCKKLECLKIGHNYISDISPLSLLKNIIELRITENDISDITPIQHLNNIKIISFSSNNISNIETLSKLKILEELYISFNNIKDFSLLKENKMLNTLSCGVNNKNKRGIEVLTQLSHLHIDGEWFYHYDGSFQEKMKEIKIKNRKSKIINLLNDI